MKLELNDHAMNLNKAVNIKYGCAISNLSKHILNLLLKQYINRQAGAVPSSGQL